MGADKYERMRIELVGDRFYLLRLLLEANCDKQRYA